MGKTVVLAEKPSVGRELARVLDCGRMGEGYLEGARYIVTWALGHLVELAPPEDYDKAWAKWDLLTLPMIPEKMKTVVIPQSARQFRAVQAQLRRSDVDSLIIATDAGREGELVARWIIEKTGWRGRTSRLWISSQTDRAIREGFARLRPAAAYDSLFYSARARSTADWVVGLNVTRALTCKYSAQLSAGRVQTPTLALIVDREKEIQRFVPRTFWTVTARMPGFTAVWRDENGQTRLFDEARARAVAAELEGGQAEVTVLRRRQVQVPPPAAYDLTELQRDANRRFAYSARETLAVAQNLYEVHKLLTYPRTDSRYLSDDMVPTLPERLRSLLVEEYRPLAQAILRSQPLQSKYLVNNAKVTDHHAIIPTEEQVELWRLSGPERNLFDLVARRFLAVLMPPCVYEEITLELQAAGHTLYAQGRVITQPGWRAAYNDSFQWEEAEEQEGEREQSLPRLEQGQRLEIRAVQLRPGKTAPPKRYTEATLLTAMEHPGSQVSDQEQGRILEETGGLGTPATRADIIEKLFASFYIERRGKELWPTSKGIQVVELAPQELRSARLTAQWESRLAAIARGEEDEERFEAEMARLAERLVAQVKASGASFHHDNQTGSPCPDCGKLLLRVKTKRGEMLVCPDRECGYRRSVRQVTNARCPNCHKKMELRGEGERRMFACVCGYREKLSDFKKRKAGKAAGKGEIRRYLAKQEQQEDKGSSALAQQLAKWLEQSGENRQ